MQTAIEARVMDAPAKQHSNTVTVDAARYTLTYKPFTKYAGYEELSVSRVQHAYGLLVYTGPHGESRQIVAHRETFERLFRHEPTERRNELIREAQQLVKRTDWRKLSTE
jgi:hypothetical protein